MNMNEVIYSNGSFDVFKFAWQNKAKGNDLVIAYGIKRTDKPQDGMIFSHTDKDFVIKIADNYKKTLI